MSLNTEQYCFFLTSTNFDNGSANVEAFNTCSFQRSFVVLLKEAQKECESLAKYEISI